MFGNSKSVSPTSSSDVQISKPKPRMPWAIHSWITRLEKFNDGIEKAVSKYQEEVRQEAAPNWGEVASTIVVEFDKKTMTVNIYSPHPDATHLEYGTPEVPPAPVIRMAAIRAQEKLIPFIKEEFAKIGLSRGGAHA
jgi:hypothetical protein